MLGELYKPKGLARETAKAVLETENVYACNMAFGCTNRCRYCYVPRFTHRKKDQDIRLPKKSPVELVLNQLEHRWKFHWTQREELGVFLSFLTDPFLPECGDESEKLIEALIRSRIHVATLSKLSTSVHHGVRQGMTIVSLDEKFHKKWEPFTCPVEGRLVILKTCKKEFGDYVWISMEPYPPSAIYKQDFDSLLEELNFVDLIVFGKWNYDKRANTEEARQEYKNYIGILEDFCRSNYIRYHVKSDTMNFVFNMC